MFFFFFFQAEDGIRDHCVTGVQTCALPICAELTAVDDAVVTRGPDVTIEAGGDGAMPHDPRPRDALVLRLAQERRHPRRMIDMAMRVDDRVEPGRRELAHQLERRVAIEERAAAS